MIFLVNFNLRKKGFSLIEILVAISILSIFAGISASVYHSFKVQNDLLMAVNTILESLRYTEKKAQSVSYDANWGVKIYSDRVEILKNGGVDETDTLPNGITTSGILEINFDKLTGKTSNAGTITVSNSLSTKNIIINSNGTINY